MGRKVLHQLFLVFLSQSLPSDSDFLSELGKLILPTMYRLRQHIHVYLLGFKVGVLPLWLLWVFVLVGVSSIYNTTLHPVAASLLCIPNK